jgi:diguanylate cyclase (GGDEF)-like protein
MQSPMSSAERAALIARALTVEAPAQALTVLLWLLVPHPAAAHEAWVVGVNLGLAPVYAVLILFRSTVLSRAGVNLSGIASMAAMVGMVWAGGGFASGFELASLWVLPFTACTVPRRDLAGHVALTVAAWALAAHLSPAPHDGVRLWGFAVVLVATVVVNTAMIHFFYGHLQATTHDFRRRSAEDPLTGLANRAALHERLEASDAGTPCAVYVIDVDGFKFVNDSLGHHAGDRLLALVAARLARQARHHDLLARPGGDEFVLVADDIADDAAALALGQRLVDSCVEPFSLDGEEVDVSVTVGVRRTAGAASGEEALRDADLALYAGKIEQRGTVKLFAADMREAASSRMTLERHLRRALDRDELHLVYQPVVAVEDGGVRGMEALLRWRCEALGDVSPADFIPIAERTGLILPIGRFVLARAVEQLAAWHAAGHDVRVSVNLSASQLTDEQLPDLLAELLVRHGVPGEALLLELTETALMRHASEQPLQMLDRLRATGAGLVLDDFGTGYSSLARLSRLRLAAVKIDRSFVAEMETDVGARAVVTAVLQMAGPLRCAVVAEGIETERQRDLLRELGCPRAQGWLFGRPEPPAAATARLEAAAQPAAAIAR